jgi:hypothetical protein
MTPDKFYSLVDEVFKGIYIEAALQQSPPSDPVPGEIGAELEALNARAREIEAEWALDHHPDIAPMRNMIREVMPKHPEAMEEFTVLMERTLAELKARAACGA